MQSAADLDVLASVHQLRQRLLLERAVGWSQRALCLGFVAVVLVELAGWIAPLPGEKIAFVGAAPLVAIVLALGWCVARAPNLDSAARIVDRRLGLRDQLGTAIELLALGDRRPLARAQVTRAGVAAAHAAREWPRRPVRDVGMLGACATLAVAIGVLATVAANALHTLPRGPSFARAPTTEEQPEIGAPAGSASRLSDLLTALQAQRSATPIDPDEAERLSELERQLADSTAEVRATQRALGRLAQALQQISAGRDIAEAVQRGRYAEAAAGLAEIARNSDHLSAQARAQLAAALRKAAEQTTESAALAARELRAAEALAGGDYAETDAALNELADALLRAGGSMLSEEDMAAAWERLREARREAQGPGTPPSFDAARVTQAETSGPATAGTADVSGDQQVGQGVGTGLGDGRPDPTGGRLEAVGVPVDVPLRAGLGQAPAGKPVDNTSQPTARVTELVSSAPTGLDNTPAVRGLRAENGNLPLDGREVVRTYFTPAGGTP